MRTAVAKAGYKQTSLKPPYTAPRLLLRPLVYSLLGAMGLLGFYMGVITLAQSWPHALQQLAEDRWFVGAIVAGFGTQVGLFTHLRGLHTKVASGGMAASTGTSTAAMLACCAHHLTEVFAVVGLSGAAIFLNLYKTPLLWLGIVMNAAGIVYLLWNIRRALGPALHSSPQGNQQEEHCH
ncbi:MAG: hypothetical protein HW403_1119 [Dehalococcoidia bacterium]|nr:hypothetical protein [Dehalococcoidia bacterium]